MAHRVRIKICGMTSLEQARQAALAGADAIGLVFARSPRRVSVEQAARIVAGLPPFVQSVGVFVDPSEEEVQEALDLCPLDLVQFHGNETPGFCKRFAPRVIKAIRVRGHADLEVLSDYEDSVKGFLLDTWSKRAMGGTGERFDWDIAREAVSNTPCPVALAGGLSPDNVAEALREVGPWAVDVSSGVEQAPGIKDMVKVKAFIEAVRSCDENG